MSNIKLSNARQLDDGHMVRAEENGDTILIQHPESSQTIKVDYWMNDYRVCVADSKGKAVTGPGFVIPSRPKVKVDYSVESMDDFNPRLIPAAIAWLGVSGDYDSQPAPGTVALAAQVAEKVAAEVSYRNGWRAVAEIERVTGDFEQHLAKRYAFDTRKIKTIGNVEKWALDTLDDATEPSTVRVRVTVDADYKRSGRDSYETTLDDVLSGSAGWLGEESVAIEAQLKPRSWWYPIDLSLPAVY